MDIRITHANNRFERAIKKRFQVFLRNNRRQSHLRIHYQTKSQVCLHERYVLYMDVV